jgi:Flp pilus assembly protein TadD
MNRLLACTSIVALCAGLVAPTAYADDTKQSATAASMPSTLEGQIQRAKDLREKGNLTEASKSLRQLMLVAASDPRVAGEYGKVLTQQGYAKDAVSILSKAVQLDGTDWTLYSALGVAYDQMDDHVNARKSYDRALAMKPGEPSILNNYAVSRMLTGDYAGAVQILASLHSNDSKIVANLSKAEEMRAAHAPKAATVAAQAPADKPNAIAAAAKAEPGVVMQKVPTDAKAGPVRSATGAPHVLASKSPVRPALAAAASNLNVNPNNIVMQKVPTDPQAGPVRAAAKPAKANGPVAIAKIASKPAAKAPAVPALRTASD